MKKGETEGEKCMGEDLVLPVLIGKNDSDVKAKAKRPREKDNEEQKGTSLTSTLPMNKGGTEGKKFIGVVLALPAEIAKIGSEVVNAKVKRPREHDIEEQKRKALLTTEPAEIENNNSEVKRARDKEDDDQKGKAVATTERSSKRKKTDEIATPSNVINYKPEEEKTKLEANCGAPPRPSTSRGFADVQKLIAAVDGMVNRVDALATYLHALQKDVHTAVDFPFKVYGTEEYAMHLQKVMVVYDTLHLYEKEGRAQVKNLRP